MAKHRSTFITFAQFIHVDRRKKEPIYLQIVYQFIQAVQRKMIFEGMQLPGTRIIHEQLKVHRKTVVAAMEELQEQGWVKIVPNVGSFVQNPQKSIKNRPKIVQKPQKSQETASFSFHRSFLLDAPFKKNNCRIQWNDGQPDYNLINTKELARFYSNAFKRKSVAQQLVDFSHRGNKAFKEQLSFYLNGTRGFHCAPRHLSGVKSKELLLYALTQLLIKSGDTVLVGEYSYFFTNMIFQQSGASLKTIPVDEEGMDINFIRQHFKKGEIRCVLVNPKNHYPTTVTLTEERREELLNLAIEYDFIVVEEDDDFSYHFSHQLPLPLATQLRDRVLYIGSFGRFLPPTFQTEFLLAPPDLIEEVEKYLQILDPRGDAVLEQALAEMIKEGDIHRYERKAIENASTRRKVFAKQLDANFGKTINYVVPSGGLAFWIKFPPTVSLQKIGEKCAEKGLFIPQICRYQNSKISALRIGYAHLNPALIKESCQILKQAYDEVLSSQA